MEFIAFDDATKFNFAKKKQQQQQHSDSKVIKSSVGSNSSTHCITHFYKNSGGDGFFLFGRVNVKFN